MRKRTPAQIIGHDALTQLIFEGYEVVPMKATPQMIAEGWACLKRNHLPTLGPGKCLIEAWPAMIEASKVTTP